MHNLLENPYTTGCDDMMANTSFNIIYNVNHDVKINVGSNRKLENMPQTSPKIDDEIPIPVVPENTTSIPMKLSLSMYQLGIHDVFTMIFKDTAEKH